MAYLNQLQPANAMKPNLDVAARGPQKKKKVQPSIETRFRNSLGGFEDVQSVSVLTLVQYKAAPGSCHCSFVTLHKPHHYPTQHTALMSCEHSVIYVEDLRISLWHLSHE